MGVTLGLMNSVCRVPLAMTHEAGEMAFRRGAALEGLRQMIQDQKNAKLIKEQQDRRIQKYGSLSPKAHLFMATGSPNYLFDETQNRRFMVYKSPEELDEEFVCRTTTGRWSAG